MAAEELALSRTDLLPRNSNPDEEANTLSGRVFNSLHNALSSPVLLSTEERRERARHSDQLATVAADTLAMLPGLKLSAAGALRAAALLDLSGQAEKTGLNFMKDFAQGAALQKLSSAVLPSGEIGARIQARFGRGLLAESISFSTAGAGLGAITAGFRSETWLDKEGNLALQQGFLELGKSTGLGAAFGLPAGFIGSRISKLGMKWGSEGRISDTTSLAISGFGSGYAGGWVLGASQGLLAGQDFKSVLQSGNEGGLAGALSGTIGLSAIARINRGQNGELALPVKKEILSPELAAKQSLERTPTDAGLAKNANRELELWRSLEIKHDKLFDSEASLSERVRRLGSATIAPMRYYAAAANAEEIALASRTFEEFSKKGGLLPVDDHVRIYAPGGGITISIPETYARRLDEVLVLRMKAAEPTNIYTRGPAHAREVYQAQEALAAHPLKNKAHPADFVHLLDELPDRTLVKDIFIREDRSPSDAWSFKGEKGSRAAATAGQEDQRITFYGQDRSPLLRDYMKHEWGHLLKWRAAMESSRFDDAAVLERDGYYVSKYSQKNHDENWSEHLSSLLNPDPDKFFDTVHGAPLRSVELGRALMRSLAAVPRGFAGTHQAEIAARLNYIHNNVFPEAQSRLVHLMQTAPKDNAILATSLLARLAGENELALLSQTARTHPDADLREAAFLSSWANVLLRRSQSANYREQTNPVPSEMRAFLISHADPASRSRQMALELLAKLPDEQSRFYHELLSMDSVKGNTLSKALDLMDRAPDAESLRKSFALALEQVGKNQEARVDLALRALDRHPRLSEEAVDILARAALPRTAPFLGDLTSHYNQRIAAKAKQALARINQEQNTEAMRVKAQSADSAEREVAFRALAADRSSKSVAALADALVAAQTDAERTLINKIARESISSEVWKFELRRQKAKNPANVQIIDKVMK